MKGCLFALKVFGNILLDIQIIYYAPLADVFFSVVKTKA